MSKRKKSRKVGQIGIPKSNIPRRPAKEIDASPTAKSNKHKGNKSGSRQQIAEAILKGNQKAKVDPKVGSKTPIDLSAYKPGQQKVKQVKVPVVVKYNTPQEELEAIENNLELEQLLEKQLKQDLNKTEQAFVDKHTARYRVLCEIMGIDIDENDDSDNNELDEYAAEDDPFAKLDAIKLDDYKD